MADSSTLFRPPDPRPHVVCINNDQAVLRLFRDLLDDNGNGPYRVTLRVQADRDLATLKALAPDVIVLDYLPADDVTGWSLLQVLRLDRATAAIPIVLCTAAVREGEALRGDLAMLGVRIVPKPFNIDRLEDAIASALAGEPATDPEVTARGS